MKLIASLLEPKFQIPFDRKRFTNKFLTSLIVPLFIEQFLIMLVGIADTLMVSYAGQESVSGVSLVSMFVTIFIYIFTALAAGGAVVISQYIGKKDKEMSNLAASQVITLSLLVSTAATILMLFFNESILKTLYGSVDPAVMESSLTYLRITTFYFPALALYNAGAAIFRSMGKTKVAMYISLLMNVIHVIGNYIAIFILKAGVAGVAWSSFVSFLFAGIVMISLTFNRNLAVHATLGDIFKWKVDMQKRILNIAIPNSIEQGLFQVSKVVLGSITALFGTSQIAANGVAQSFWSMSALIGVALGPAFITVVGQSIGSNDTDAAKYYMAKLLKITYLSSIIWNVFILILTPFALRLYQLPDETKQLIIILVIIHNLFNASVFPISSPFSNGIRAAGDVRYAMVVSIFATVIVRVILSYLFGIVFNLGVIGIALAMGMDWCVRAVLIYIRYQNGKWLSHHVI